MRESKLGKAEAPFSTLYVYWPAFSLRSSMYVMDLGLSLPGQALWVDRTRANLGTDLRNRITILNEMDTLPRILHEQLKQSLSSLTVPDFLDWLSHLSPNDIADFIPPREKISVLQEGRARFGLDDAIADWDGAELDPDVVGQIEELLASPKQLKILAHQTSEQFWYEHLEPEFRRTEALIREIVDRGNSHPGKRTRTELIRELVGRDPAGDSFDGSDGMEVIAIPVCHLGAFVLTRILDDQGPIMLAAFEARRSPLHSSPPEAGATSSTYRALADETRLSIIRLLASGEQYGTQIVEYCALSQPTVSKHLRILVSQGILTVRRDGGTKYYSVNKQRLKQIAQDVEDLGSF